MDRQYDVIIVGGGIAGTSLLYTLVNYTSVKRILLIERRDGPGQVTSSSSSNSQTLHFGDIESNYTIKKAGEVKSAAEMLLRYIRGLDAKTRSSLMISRQKMLLGVGEDEVETLRKKYDSKFLALFPKLVEIGRKELEHVEPYVVRQRPRDTPVTAFYCKEGYIVDFGKLCNQFLKDSKSRKADVLFNKDVESMSKTADGYEVTAGGTVYRTRFLVVSAGTHTLRFAKSLGYGDDIGQFPVLGRFFYTPSILQGKVYTVQKGTIPFLAVHGDPDIRHSDRSRFGPTVNIYPFLDRSAPSTFADALDSMGIDGGTFKTFSRILADREMSGLFMRHTLYALPGIGARDFTENEIKKIVPSIDPSIVRPDEGGGIRSQAFDKKKGEIKLGEVKISGDGVIFNMAASPGASSCFRMAYQDATAITSALDVTFDKDALEKSLGRL